MRILKWLQGFLALTVHCSRTENGYTRKTIDRRRLAPDSLIQLVPATPPVGFSSGRDVTDHCTLTGSPDSHLPVCRDHSTPPLLVCKHGMGSVWLPLVVCR